jgi:Protein of unknown function (DUF3710)
VFRRRRRERADQLRSKADGAPEEQDSAEQQLVLDDPEGGPADEEVLLTVEDAVLADPEGGLTGPEAVLADPEGGPAEREPAAAGPGTAGPGTAGPGTAGPWDAHEEFPPHERVDFGSLQVPVSEGFEIQLNLAEDQGPLITVVRGESSLQLQAFAAPKSGGLWDDVRHEIAAAVAEAGGSSDEADGRFGVELRARVTATQAGPEGRPEGRQPIRFLGVDGPRWFLRGVITGPAAHHRSAAEPLEDVFAGTVVVRGDHPAPPRDLLEIQLPEQARQAMEEQMAAEAEGARSIPDPFERGPEITEIR